MLPDVVESETMPDEVPHITAKQLNVLKAMASLDYKKSSAISEAAETLGIEPRSVKSHLRDVNENFYTYDALSAVYRALHWHMLSLEELDGGKDLGAVLQSLNPDEQNLLSGIAYLAISEGSAANALLCERPDIDISLIKHKFTVFYKKTGLNRVQLAVLAYALRQQQTPAEPPEQAPK